MIIEHEQVGDQFFVRFSALFTYSDWKFNNLKYFPNYYFKQNSNAAVCIKKNIQLI